MRRADYALATIGLAMRPVSPVQLQKSLFLLSRKTPSEALPAEVRYQFRPYDYGPLSHDVYSDAEELERQGFVRITRPPTSRYKQYELTDLGKVRFAQVTGELAPPLTDFLSRVVRYTQSLTFDQLVSAVYREFPEMKANSVFKDA